MLARQRSEILVHFELASLAEWSNLGRLGYALQLSEF